MWNWIALSAVSGVSEVPPRGFQTGAPQSEPAADAVAQWGPLTVDLAHFTPWLSLAGGLMIGLSAVLVLWLFGQTAGISGLTAAVARGDGSDGGGWKSGVIAGLIGSGAAATVWAPHLITAPTNSWALLAVAGVCVGLGTRTGGGCTSGHGVCGLGRARPRSAVAVPIFMAFGALTVFLLRAFGGSA